MILSERVDLTPTVSFEALFEDGAEDLGGETGFALADYAEEISHSGFPGIRNLEPRARRAQLDGYVNRVVDRDFEDELGRQVRRPETLRAWMAAYAASVSTVTSMEKIRKAATPGESAPAQATTQAYRDALLRLFILDPIDGWLPGSTHLKRLAQAPKHHLVDPALAVSLLGLSAERLLRGEGAAPAIPIDRPFLGSLFESLAAQSVRVFAQAGEARVYHLRTRNGDHEVDLIAEKPSGEVVAIEVKLSGTVDDDDVKHLRWLQAAIGDRLADAVVITTGRFAYRRPDGVAVVPLALLGF
jgi:predicted AAA+ superfamily ATPase